MNDKLKEAIETFERLRHYIQTDVNKYGGGWDSIVEAIDTVVAELEKPLPSDDEAGTMAASIASKSKPNLTAQEEAFFIAGFIECAKWMRDLIRGRMAK